MQTRNDVFHLRQILLLSHAPLPARSRSPLVSPSVLHISLPFSRLTSSSSVLGSLGTHGHERGGKSKPSELRSL